MNLPQFSELQSARGAMKLRLKLTLSYVGVTLLTLLVLGAVVIALTTQQFSNTFSDGKALATDARTFAPAAAAFWRPNGEIDKAGLEKSAQRIIAIEEKAGGGFANLQMQIAFTDRTGRTVAAWPKGSFSGSPQLADTLTEREQVFLRNAFRQSEDETELSGATSKNQASIAIPLEDSEGRFVGVMYTKIQGALAPGFQLAAIQSLMPITGMVLLIGSICSIGLGHLMARKLTTRIDEIGEAANRWRTGDFRSTAPELPADELGQLGQHLNEVARDMSRLVEQRERLAQFGERSRMARDLHDTVKQHTFAAAMQLAIAERTVAPYEPALTNIRHASQLVERARRDLTAMIYDAPEPDFAETVADAIRQRTLEWSASSQVAATLEIEASGELPASQRHTVLRILDEALANVARHSRAATVNVAYRSERNRAFLSIEDDGVGFDAGNATSGMGLDNMRTRALSLPGGGFCLRTAPGSGTSIEVDFELRAEVRV